MAALVLPISTIIVLFSKELLTAWFGSGSTVSQTHLLVSLLIIGTTLNCIMTLPYALQIANGWTGLSFYKNVVSVSLFVPLILWLIAQYGAAGAALAWIALNLGYFLIEVPVMHRRLLTKSMSSWYLIDVGLPVAISLGMGLVARLIIPLDSSPYMVLVWIAIALMLTSLCTALAMPHTRVWLRDVFFGIRSTEIFSDDRRRWR